MQNRRGVRAAQAASRGHLLVFDYVGNQKKTCSKSALCKPFIERNDVMGRLLNLVTELHKRTKRDHLARMLDDKVNCMKKAREYGFDYWDGDRRYGFGGYKYD